MFYKNRKEVQYFNNNSIYKESIIATEKDNVFRTTKSNTGITTDYTWDGGVSMGQSPFGFYAVKEKNGVTEVKTYIASPEYSNLTEVTADEEYSTEGFDICSDIQLVVAIGVFENSNNKDFFFHVTDYALLETVSGYYGLPTPITEDMFNSFEEDKVFHTTSEGTDIVVAGIVFDVDNTPVRFKFYNFPTVT